MALTPDRRTSYLIEACDGDPAVRSELESLLAVADRFPPPDDPPEETAPQDAPPLPERIGRYPVVGVVGAGGMGLVYRVRDPDLEREVALKRLPPGIQAKPVELARFRREARILARLSHPNIATVHSLESDAEGPFLTMELVPGRTLHEILAAGRLSPARALRIGVRIAYAIETAHAAGIVHRDLKPLNIQVGEADEVKVLDFGLAKAVDEPAADAGSGAAEEADEPGGASATATPATLSGPVVGTPGYISPEHLLGRPVGPAADLWAFGCVLFECLAGASPFAVTGSAARIPTRLRRTLGALDLEPDWSLLPAGLPAGIEELLRSCLRAEPGDRPTADDARRALERAMEAIASPSGTAGLISRRGAVALAFLTLAIAGAVMIGRPWRPVPVGLPASSVRQLTFRGNTLACDLSPDGRTAAYLDETGRLVYLDLQTGQERAAPLTTGAADDTIVVVGARSIDLRWAPSGRELAVVAARNAADRTMKTYIVARGEHRAVALGDVDFAGVVWSPDGTRLAGTRGLAATARLCIIEREDGRCRDVPVDGAVKPLQVLDWATGDRLMFKAAEIDSIYTVPVTGGAPRAVLKTPWLRFLPARDGICWYADHQLKYASLGPDGRIAEDHSVLVDRLPAFASQFSLARDGRRLLYDNAALIEAWLGERETASADDDDFRWTRLVRESISTYAARFSPDGSRVALVGAPAGEKASVIQILSLADGVRTIATRDTAINWPDWSPDGTELVYRNSRGMTRVRISGDSPRQIPGPRDPMYIRWLPDGRIIYMEGDGDLWHNYSQLDTNGGRIARLPIDTDRGTLFQFAMAPDGNSVAVAGNRGERDEVKVWLIDLTDGSERLLYDGWAAPFEWSADGRWIYLVAEHEPASPDRRRSRILRVAVSGGEIETVADLPEPLFTWDHIDLSRDGKRIVCDQRRTGRDLWLIDIEPIRN